MTDENANTPLEEPTNNDVPAEAPVEAPAEAPVADEGETLEDPTSDDYEFNVDDEANTTAT